MKLQTVGVTGHRFIEHSKKDILDGVKYSFNFLAYTHDFKKVITGMALGYLL
jgi:hypothetical protein